MLIPTAARTVALALVFFQWSRAMPGSSATPVRHADDPVTAEAVEDGARRLAPAVARGRVAPAAARGTSSASAQPGDAHSQEILRKSRSDVRFSTDKFDMHKYETMYGLFLGPLRGVRGLRMLEIGLGCTMGYGPGRSANFWRAWLPDMELWEAEVDAACVRAQTAAGKLAGIHTLVGSQSDSQTLRSWVQQIRAGARSGPRGDASGLDVIIDDGSHRSVDILRTFGALWEEALNPGGLYFMEDLHAATPVGRRPQWEESGGEHVVPDVLSSWAEQLASTRGLQSGGRLRRSGGATTTQQGPQVAHDELETRARAAKHPLPRFIKFVLCQPEACVVAKCTAREMRDDCRKGHGSGHCCATKQPPRSASSDIYANITVVQRPSRLAAR